MAEQQARPSGFRIRLGGGSAPVSASTPATQRQPAPAPQRPSAPQLEPQPQPVRRTTVTFPPRRGWLPFVRPRAPQAQPEVTQPTTQSQTTGPILAQTPGLDKPAEEPSKAAPNIEIPISLTRSETQTEVSDESSKTEQETKTEETKEDKPTASEARMEETVDEKEIVDSVTKPGAAEEENVTTEAEAEEEAAQEEKADMDETEAKEDEKLRMEVADLKATEGEKLTTAKTEAEVAEDEKLITESVDTKTEVIEASPKENSETKTEAAEREELKSETEASSEVIDKVQTVEDRNQEKYSDMETNPAKGTELETKELDDQAVNGTKDSTSTDSDGKTTETQMSQKAIEEDGSTIVNKTGGERLEQNVDEKSSGVMSAGFSGVNEGAAMHIHNGNHAHKEKAKERTEKRSDHPTNRKRPSSMLINSNVQSINNSILMNSSCHERSPGVHLVITIKPLESVNLKETAKSTNVEV